MAAALTDKKNIVLIIKWLHGYKTKEKSVSCEPPAIRISSQTWSETLLFTFRASEKLHSTDLQTGRFIMLDIRCFVHTYVSLSHHHPH